MVAPIVPFVVGILSNLAQRKEEAKAVTAATAKAEHETSLVNLRTTSAEKIARGQREAEYATNRLNLWSNERIEFIKNSKGSLLPDVGRNLMSIIYGDGPDAKPPNNLTAPYLPLLQKMSGWRTSHEGADTVAKASLGIGQFANVNDEEWAHIQTLDKRAYGGALPPIIKSLIKSNVVSLQNAIRDTEEGYIQGPLDWRTFGWDTYPKWLKGFISNAAEMAMPGSSIDADDKQRMPTVNITDNEKPLYDFRFNKGQPYPSLKYYNDKKKYVAQTYAQYHTHPSNKIILGNKDAVNPLNAYKPLEIPAINQGWVLFSSFFTQEMANGDRRAIGRDQAWPFANEKIIPAASFIFEQGLRSSERTLSNEILTLHQEKKYFPWVKSAMYNITALSSVANSANLPGVHVEYGTKQWMLADAKFKDSKTILRDHLGLTDTILGEYTKTADIGDVAMGASLDAQLIIKNLKLGGEKFFSLAKLKGQILDFFPQLLGAFGIGEDDTAATNQEANFAELNSTFTTQIKELELAISPLSNRNFNALSNSEQQQLGNLEAAKELLQDQLLKFQNGQFDTYIDGKRVTVNYNDAFKKDGDAKGIAAARLGLIRASLVFYAAAIFQGEGGKAISDGDRKLVSQALAIDNFATVGQAQGALAQFDKGMGIIVARARAIASRNPAMAWAALNYYNVYDHTSQMMSALPAEKRWVLFGPVGGGEGEATTTTSTRLDPSANYIIVDTLKSDLTKSIGKLESLQGWKDTYDSISVKDITEDDFIKLENHLVTTKMLKPEKRRTDIFKDRLIEQKNVESHPPI